MLLKVLARCGFAAIAAIAGCAAYAQAPVANPSLEEILSGADFPPMRSLILTLQPAPLLVAESLVLPPMRDLTLTLQPPVLQPPPELAQFQLPPMRNLMLTLQPAPPLVAESLVLPPVRDLTLTLQPPALQPPPELAQFQLPPMRNLTLMLHPPGAEPTALASGLKPRPLSVAEPPPSAIDPAVLALIATASFPAPQALAAVLVPPPSPYAAIANANLPAPQPLSAVLVPPQSPYAAIAGANFPVPQPLAAVLVPGTLQTTATLVAGLAPQFSVGDFSVQMVQAIPRRGVNFFDQNDPTGQSTVLVAQPGSPSAPTGVSTSACTAGPSSGGTFQSVTPAVNFECHSLVVVSGPGDVLAMGDFHIDLLPPGASLVASININSGPTFAVLTGSNKSTFSLTGVTTAPRGTVPAGTPMRIDGTVTTVPSLRFNNFTLTVCPVAGTVVYRRAAGNCL